MMGIAVVADGEDLLGSYLSESLPGERHAVTCLDNYGNVQKEEHFHDNSTFTLIEAAKTWPSRRE